MKNKKIKVTPRNIEKAIKKNSKTSKIRKNSKRVHEQKSIEKAMKSQGIDTKTKKQISTSVEITIIIACTIIITIIIFSFYESGLDIYSFTMNTIKKLF